MFEFLENCCPHCWFQEELGEVLGSTFCPVWIYLPSINNAVLDAFPRNIRKAHMHEYIINTCHWISYFQRFYFLFLTWFIKLSPCFSTLFFLSAFTIHLS
jgi:hypothetical protein